MREKMMQQQHRISVDVCDAFILNAGWWEETRGGHISDPLPCRLIHPPEPTLYDQILGYLETIFSDAKVPPKSQLNFGEVAWATIAICLRWGTYFAVLTDQTKPLWPQTEQQGVSLIADEEMARINVEASAALARWIELMRTDDGHFRKLVKAAQHLPLLPSPLDEKTNPTFYRLMSFWNSAQSRQNLLVMLREQYGQEWFEQKRGAIMPNPVRWLANGLINASWRNTSGIEDMHAGRWEALPLLQQRVTLLQADTIVQNMAQGIVPSMHALYNVLKKKSEDEWQERVFSLAIRFSLPPYWSLTEQSREVLLEGPEPSLSDGKACHHT